MAAIGIQGDLTYGSAAWERQVHVDDEEAPEGNQKTIAKKANEENDGK